MRILILVGCLMSGVLIGGVLAIIPAHAQITKGDLFRYTNQARAANNIPLLVESKKLDDAASLKALDMVKDKYFAHVSPTKLTPWYWINLAKYKFSLAGENLAVNFSNSLDIVKAWLNSPPHKKNILNANFKDAGYAVVQTQYKGEDAILVVQMFGKPTN